MKSSRSSRVQSAVHVGGDRWRLRHDGVLRVIMQEFREVKDNVYNLFVGKFGERDADSERRAAAFLDRMVGLRDRQRRHRQGLRGCSDRQRPRTARESGGRARARAHWLS